MDKPHVITMVLFTKGGNVTESNEPKNPGNLQKVESQGNEFPLELPVDSF